MELQTTSALDLKVSKEDLIDIIIDEQLTVIEGKIEVINVELKKFNEELLELSKKDRDDLDKKLLKFLPKEIVSKNVPKLNYSGSYSSINVAFNFENFSVNVQNLNTVIPKNNKRDEIRQQINERVNKLSIELHDLSNQKRKLESNDKRIKSKMIKTFLTKTKEGMEILKVLGQSKTDVKLLTLK